MRTITIFVLLIAFLGMSFLSFYLLREKKSGYMEASDLKYVSSSGNKAESLEQAFIIDLLNSNTQLENMTVRDFDGSEMPFSQLLTEQPILFIRFSELNCSECVAYILNKARRLSKENGYMDKIVLLASYQEKRNLKIQIKEMRLNFPVYLIDKLKMPCEEANYPYCFVADQSMKACHVFIPDKSEPKLTNLYFELIYLRYFKQR